MTNHIWLLAKRDFLQRARSKGFLVMMGLTVVLIIAIGPIASAIAPEDKPIGIGLLGSEPDGIEAALDTTADAYGQEVETRTFEDRDRAEAALTDGDVAVVLIDGDTLLWKGDPGSTTSAIVQGAVDALDRQQTIAELGLSGEEAARLLLPGDLEDQRLEPEDPEQGPRIVAGYATIFILYLAILVFGQFVMMGVMEEKSSRVVEVVLSRAKPESVLAGKVLGIGALGLLQVVALAAAGLITAKIADTGDLSIPDIGVGVAVSAVLWFILGFGLYAVLYAGLGSTVTRQEDVQGAAMIPALLILPAYFIALISLESPDSMMSRIASIFPPTAPIVMPMRTAVTDVPWYEVALSVGLIVVTVYLMIKISARIYRGAALRIGAKVSLREAWRTADE